MKKLFVFDLDGTLTDPKEGITKSVCYALHFFNIEKNPDDVVSFIGPPLKQQFKEFAALSDKQAEKAVEVYRERFAPIGIYENKLIDGIIPMLDELCKRGAKMAVATSKPTVFAKKIADRFGISRFMEGVFGSELDGTDTDKACVIKKAMKKLGALPQNTVMVGDRIHDITGAEKNKIPAIGVTFGYAPPGELEKSNAAAVCASPEELLKILISM